MGKSTKEAGSPSAVRHLVAATKRMPASTHSLWSTRFAHVYGDLSGQRSVNTESLREWVGSEAADRSGAEILFGLQTYFSIVADLLAAAGSFPDGAAILKEWSRQKGAEMERFLSSLSSGQTLAQQGVLGAQSAFDFDWYVGALDINGLRSLSELMLQLSNTWDVDESQEGSLDPVSRFYTAVLPKNFLHVLGEVYTPGWLAEMVLADSEWRVGDRLIDPFCGSGVFAMAALRAARRAGVPPSDVLPDICLIDLNPFACAAARANLVLGLATEIWRKDRPDLVLPVICADSIAPALAGRDSGARGSLFPDASQVAVDGELVTVPLTSAGLIDGKAVGAALERYGLRLPKWIGQAGTSTEQSASQYGTRDRRFWEQLAVLSLEPADVLVTNPPWVGWEYIARPYRNYLNPAWETYGLFNAKGRDASFLKEDLSTLALVTAWDHYLRDGGRSAVVLRENTMLSSLAGKGLRRLSIHPDSSPLRLGRIRLFDGLRVFPNAQVQAATWSLTKGESTAFPVNASVYSSKRTRWQPDADAALSDTLSFLEEASAVAERVEDRDSGSRWLIGPSDCVLSARALAGDNAYVGRTGVFTGGANAVYYVATEEETESNERLVWCQNSTKRSKRDAPSVRVQLERALIYEVIRGRDVTRWASRAGAKMICPHSAETKMRALPLSEMEAQFPASLRYLQSMRPILDARKGFTAWDRAFQEESFYAIQRVGEYTFAPYKVAWRYIATDFLVAVVGPDSSSKPRLPNDKVMFVGLQNQEEAFYLCGVLSSDPVRWKVMAYASGTQISASAIAPLGIPRYNRTDVTHKAVASACEEGHQALAAGNVALATQNLEQINEGVAKLFGLPNSAMIRFRAELLSSFATDWPSLSATYEADE